jgi:glucosamine-6-phosphate deaminase
MKLILTEDYAALSRAAADLFVSAVQAKPDAAIVVATGNSPVGMYRELATRYQAGQLDLAQTRIFQLDEYLGLGEDDPRLFYSWMLREFNTPLGIRPEQVVRFHSSTPDPAADCQAYAQAVAAAGGFDLSILGIGPNGHLAMNEPPGDPNISAHVSTLAAESIVSNTAYWGSRYTVPSQGLTVGLRELLAARQTLLVASGTAKRAILRRAVEGPITPEVPASYLQQATNVTVIADRAAWD